MRCLTVSLVLLAAAACHRADPEGAQSRQPAAAETDPESGQGRALEAGRELIGKPAPPAVVQTIDGPPIDLAKLYGRKPVYLKFWATWCVPCRQQMPSFEADFEKYGDRIATIAVNTGFNDSIEAIRAYRIKHGLKMPITMDDGSLGEAFNLRVTPQHVVIGRDGRILYVGHLVDDHLEAALQRAIAEAPAAPPRTAGPSAPAMPDAQLTRVAGFPLTGLAPDPKPRVLVFLSPWCETYLKKSRPDSAEACRRVRLEVGRLAGSGGAHWLGIASGLWATGKDLTDYRAEKDAYKIPLYLDSNGALFRSFHVQDVPTVIILDEHGGVARRLGPKDSDLSTALRKAMKSA